MLSEIPSFFLYFQWLGCLACVDVFFPFDLHNQRICQTDKTEAQEGCSLNVIFENLESWISRRLEKKKPYTNQK